MSPALLIAALGQTFPATTLVAEARTPIPVVFSSFDAVGPRTSDIIRALDELITRNTRFSIRVEEHNLRKDCNDQLRCIIPALRTSRPAPPYAIFLSGFKTATASLISVAVMDLEAGETHLKKHPQSEEIAILKAAIVHRPKPTELKDEDELRTYLEQLLHASLTRKDVRWTPFGEIALQAQHAGIEIVLDGKVLGQTSKGPMRLSNVPAGRRTLELRGTKIPLFKRSVEVSAGATSNLLEVVEQRPPNTHLLRQVTRWSGIAVFVGGSVALAISLLRQKSATAGAQPKPAFMLGPMGYSAMLTGAIWTLGAWFFGEDHTIPWIQMVAGAAAFGLSYGLTAVAAP